MKNDLEKYGVSVVAISKDDAKTAGKHKVRDHLTLTLLADPGLDVIRQYGVEHHKALEVSGPSITVFGITLGFIPSIKKMAIPTSLLIDEHGVIRWVDQTGDYRLRSSEELVIEAVNSVFGQRNPVKTENKTAQTLS